LKLAIKQLHKTPTMQNFVAKNAGDIRDRKFVLPQKFCFPKKWAKVHQNFLGDATPQNP